MTSALVALLLLAQGESSLLLAQGESKVKIQKGPEVVAEPPGLGGIRRVYVDKFGGGAAAELLREMLISSLQNSRLFIVTEDQEHADATMKGSAEADAFKDVHITSSHENLRKNGSNTRIISTAGRFSTRDQSSSSSDTSGGDGESSHIEERKHEASAAVRLVLKNGDVIWSTTQESLGAKFRGASADVADKIARQLALDWRKAKAD